MRYESQENAVYIAIHPTTYRGGGFLAHCVLKERTISDETKRRMSENHADVTGAKNPSAKAVRQFDTNGTFIKEYPYATAAANELGIDLPAIIKCCRGKVKSCGGFRWEYVNQ